VAKAPPLVGGNVPVQVAVAQFKLPEGNDVPIPVAKATYQDNVKEETQIAAIEQLIAAEETPLAFAAMAPKPVLPAVKELEKLTNQPTQKQADERVTDSVSAIINEKADDEPLVSAPAMNAPAMSDREHDALLLAALVNEYPGSQPTILTMNALLEESDLTALAGADENGDEELNDAQEIDIFTTASISNSKKGWVIQVASTKTVREADIALYKALSAGSNSLEKAEPYLKISEEKANQPRYYRARFAGFKSQKSALKTCVDLQSKAIECYVLED